MSYMVYMNHQNCAAAMWSHGGEDGPDAERPAETGAYENTRDIYRKRQ